MTRDPLKELERFAEEVSRASGDNLVSLILYGSAARGDFDPERSDLNLLMILREVTPATLRPLGDAVRNWVRRGQPPPWIFSEAGFRASADVFPMEIEDMKEAHRVLRGSSPFGDIKVERTHLRAQLEREARQKLLQLRAHYAATEADGKALSRLVESSFRSFLVVFRALVRVAGEAPPRTPEALVQSASVIAGLDLEAFRWALDRNAGKKVAPLGPYDPIAARYLEAIEQLVLHIDRLA
ncbi:MAG: hypothetical protein KatS3mg081_1955 [Gemmatimonadales bacterium]|nr:MAG: hypothetical protein KatS3mg081_1955 [Gemmatimonadales bacterium]